MEFTSDVACFSSSVQAIEAAKVDKTDKPFTEMKIISIDIS